MSRSSLALDNFRAVVILVVLAFHSVLAYVNWIPDVRSGFDDPPYLWRAFPISTVTAGLASTFFAPGRTSF